MPRVSPPPFPSPAPRERGRGARGGLDEHPVSSRRLLALGLAANALLLAGSLAFILRARAPSLLDGDDAPASAAAGPAGASASPAMPPTLLPEGARAIPAVPPPPPAPGRKRTATSGVAHPSPADPPRPVTLKPSRQTWDFFSALGDLQGKIDECAARSPRPAPAGHEAQTVLRLTMETLDGQVLVHDAAVEREGDASPALVGCAQQLLRGARVPMAAARPGTRMEMQLPLTDAVAGRRTLR
ncbi:hypothetical protein [Anaeromyxobacter paludicola]|uniref:Uncharacterized protein n=1 Tax=Anaeromyxobacter paludicola TaxID=2918171 RepID=A0ABM7XCM4_9BACT|nr:hypothetical protein [Anaeromyxobacter paludicola]BDG09624.1 hypothetical protein AMPC_27370 [Anaeromyxobacter paludicola]